MHLCDFGCGQLAVKQFKNGKHCCSIATSSCPSMRARNKEKLKELRKNKGNSFWKNGHPRGSKNGTSLKGKTWQEIYGDRAEFEKNKRIQSSLGNHSYNKWSPEKKREHAIRARERILKRYENGWMPKAGRCKKYKHVSPIAGEVYVDGTWELLVAQWLDNCGYEWKRNTKRFPYTNPDGKLSHYTPDFWVKELGGYLEIKGYETSLDRCKWSQFTEPLTVWKRKNLIEVIGRLP